MKGKENYKVAVAAPRERVLNTPGVIPYENETKSGQTQINLIDQRVSSCDMISNRVTTSFTYTDRLFGRSCRGGGVVGDSGDCSGWLPCRRRSAACSSIFWTGEQRGVATVSDTGGGALVPAAPPSQG